jgi:hypothetical protein
MFHFEASGFHKKEKKAKESGLAPIVVFNVQFKIVEINVETILVTSPEFYSIHPCMHQSEIEVWLHLIYHQVPRYRFS